jgi:hypothetical protein
MRPSIAALNHAGFVLHFYIAAGYCNGFADSLLSSASGNLKAISS